MNLNEKDLVELIQEGNLKQSVIILMESLVLLNTEVEKLKQDNSRYESMINNSVGKDGKGERKLSIG